MEQHGGGRPRRKSQAGSAGPLGTTRRGNGRSGKGPRGAVLGAALAAVVLLGACTPGGAPGSAFAPSSSSSAPAQVVARSLDGGSLRIEGEPAHAAVAASRTFFAGSPLAVLVSSATPADAADLVRQGAQRARELGVPLLLTNDDGAVQRAVRTELQRLGARQVLRYGETVVGSSEMLRGLEVLPADAEVDRPTHGGEATPAAVVHLANPGVMGRHGLAAVLASAEAAGAEVRQLAGPDPRSAANRDFFRETAGRPLVAVGGGFGEREEFSALVETAATGPDLPGGGQLLFPDRRMVALYGHPETGALGLLGEQDADAAVERVRELAEQYQPFSEEPVQPAFEIIATVASAAPGDDGRYSRYTQPHILEPWIDAAEEAGVYVVLDLQPGRNDFLTQAKRYEDLLKRPHVGLAMDPEWRLEPGQRHMRQIGSVDAAEVNEVTEWLAGLTRTHRLPQKLVVLHQFQLRMIQDRDQLETGHPELSLVVHADGNGTPEQKMDTWNALKTGLPEGVRLAWKNFIDEDTPTFSPRRTFEDVSPKPWFVSYQ